jgi:hypothetical protein
MLMKRMVLKRKENSEDLTSRWGIDRFCSYRAYTPGTHAKKEEDGLLLEFPCNPTRTRSV